MAARIPRGLAASPALLLAVALCGCSKRDASAPATDADDAGPTWLGDAGLATRAPVARPLHELCGIASNPGDMPLGDGAAETALRSGYFDAAKDLGGVMIRRDFRFSEIEPQRGTFDFAAHDRLVSDAKTRGVRILANLNYGTTWAAASGAKDEYYPPADPRDFADYAKACASRYAGEVVAWEIWNEPNNGFRFWKPTLSGDPAAYGALLAATHDAIRAADPNAAVMLGGTVFTPQLIEGAMDWLGEAYAARPDLAKSFELCGVHTYASYPPTRAPEVGEAADAPLEAKLQMHAWLLAAHGGADKPISVTELGWPVYDVVDEATQARFTVRATILAARAGASGIFWYTLRDGPHPEAFPPEDAFGLLHHDGSPKPVYVALKALLSIVGERWPTADDPGIADLPADGYAVRFGGAGAPVVAVWTVQTTGASVHAAAPADVVDQSGAARGSVAAGGAVTIGPDVTYLLAK